MKISLDWLRDYVQVDIPVPELVDRLNMIGLVVDSLEEKGGDTILDIETYANRPDTLGHLGVAREVAAMLGVSRKEKAWPLEELDEKTAAAAGIQILDETLCPRYCGLVVRGVAVGPSPEWLRKRLEAMGLRPINNIVDISNYVLYATGQPIHTFDLAKLGGAKIVVRRALRGEKLLDLEGRTLELSPEMLVIADQSKPVALAGVIGGAESAVGETTRDVFIESAYFDPVSIRLTGKKLGLQTDASYRFERGTDPSFPPRAAVMAASLMAPFGGKATAGVLDVYPKPRKPRSVILRYRRTIELLGADVPDGIVEPLLTQLGFRVESQQPGIWRVEVPTFRVDIDREADLVEEVARFYGYDRIPSEVTPVRSFEFTVNPRRDRVEKLRQAVLEQGFDEVINWSFADPEKESLLASGRAPIVLKNPISIKASVLRTNLLMGLLENAVWNLHRGLEGVHVFEVGNVYFWQGEKLAEAHEERLSVGLLTTGLLAGGGWREKPRATDFYVLKGAVEAALARLRFEPLVFEEAEHPFFEKGQSTAVLYKERPVGHFGLVRRPLAAAYALDRPVFAAEIDLARLFEKQPRPFEYASVPKFPGVVRDLSFLVEESVTYQDIRRVLEKLAPPLLESFELTDRYSGAGVPAGRVSLSIRFRYRHPKRTLVAEEVDQVEQDIIGQLRTALAVHLREGKIDNRTRAN